VSYDAPSEATMHIAYVRISKQEQNGVLQIDTLKNAGYEK
jgi:DNA invertase Pin-like site-specific DNA recombinase